ncbi:MAG TPA: hypothetical protein VI299_04350 [Polyangiales bacterium]
MSTAQPIKAEVIAKHVHALLQTNVTVKEVPAQDVKPPLVFGQIVDEAGALVCVVLADVACAGSTGAALSKIPSGAVTDLMRRNRPLDEDLLANYHEVVNVLTVLTTAALGRRTILRTVDQTPKLADPQLLEFVKNAKHKLAYQVGVQGYPAGALNVYHV